MQALVEKAQNLTVRFEETCLLQNYWLEAQTWTSMADELIKIVRSDLLSSNEAESSYPCRADYSRVLLSQCEEQRLKLNIALEEGSNLNLGFPAIVELQTLLTMTLWSIRTLKLLSSQSHLEVRLFPLTSYLKTRFCSTDSKFQSLTLYLSLCQLAVYTSWLYIWLEILYWRLKGCFITCWFLNSEQVAESLLNEARSFPFKTKAGVLLQGAVQKAEFWKCKVKELIPLYGKARTCTKRQLEQLLLEAQVQCTCSIYLSIIFCNWAQPSPDH